MGLGWALLVFAFFAACAETAYRGAYRDAGMWVGADEVWAGLAPRTFEAFRAWVVGTLHPAVWHDVLRPALVLPGWLTVGVPGAAFVWAGAARRARDSDAGEHAASLFLYDALARRAREDGYADDGDDRAPTHDVRPVPDDGQTGQQHGGSDAVAR